MKYSDDYSDIINNKYIVEPKISKIFARFGQQKDLFK
jgi:hypothetical protein